MSSPSGVRTLIIESVSFLGRSKMHMSSTKIHTLGDGDGSDIFVILTGLSSAKMRRSMPFRGAAYPSDCLVHGWIDNTEEHQHWE